MTFGLLISGDLGNITLCHFLNHYALKFVMTDKASKKIIENCEKNNIPLFIGNPRTNKVNTFIIGKKCEIIISVNYIFLIKKNIINLSSGLCFNIHGSLLPKYRGRTPHVWAIINNEKKTGITAHIIDEGCDTGGILEQIEVEIDKKDSGWDILEKYKKLYVPLIERVLKKYASNSLKVIPQNEKEATFFPKRSPEDGLIDWNWNSIRIENWIRAQRIPYPGAFSIFKNKKIIIDDANKIKYKYDCNLRNGTIISIKPLIIKCSDEAIKINKLREINSKQFKLFEILN